MKEEWKDIPGYEGYYQASSLGRIRSLTRVVLGRRGILRGKLLKLSRPNKYYAYFTVELNALNKAKRFSVHRLVLLSFCGAHPTKKQANHMDGDKTNNRISNLSWVTPSENGLHAFKTGLSYTPWKRRVIRSDGVVFESIKEAAIAIGANRGHLWKILNSNGGAKTARGFAFKYLEKK